MPRRKGSTGLRTALRLLRLLQTIPRRTAGGRRKIGTRELVQRLADEGFSVTQRTVQRDLVALQGVFPGLETDGNRDQAGWYWREDTPLHDVPSMTPAVALAFRIGERLLQPTMPAALQILDPYLRTARAVLEGGSETWVERIHVVPRSMPLQPADVDSAVLEAVCTGLLERRRLRARYRPRNGELGEYELSPLGLVLRHEVAYLVATAWNYDDPRHYALHRFERGSVEVLETEAHIPHGFDLDRYVASGEFQYRLDEKPVDLVLRMRADVARHLEETPLDPAQRITPCDEDWVRIQASVPDTLQLRWWLLGLGEHVVVEAPETLRREIRDLLSRTLQAYQVPPSAEAPTDPPSRQT